MTEPMRLKQGDFADRALDFPSRPSVEVKKITGDIYGKTLDRIKSLGLALYTETANQDELQQFSFLIDKMRINPLMRPVFKNPKFFRIQDIPVPDEIRALLDEYGTYTGEERRSKIIQAGILYDESAFDDMTPLERSNPLVALPLDHPYHAWYEELVQTWHDQSPQFAGLHGIRRDVHEKGDLYSVRYSAKGKLSSFIYSRQHPEVVMRKYSNHSLLETKATFKGEALFSFWQDVLNGTFFEDPKGEKESIWPRWLKGISWSYQGGLGTETDWELYLDKVRRGERVISPKTQEFVHQTETQAIRNLADWRTYIYNLHPQTVYIKRVSDEPGIKGVMGYRVFGQYGAYISKNPESYKRLTSEEAIKIIKSWK